VVSEHPKDVALQLARSTAIGRWNRSPLGIAAAVAVLTATTLTLSRLFRATDWPLLRASLAHLGAFAWLVPIPTFFGLLSDTVAWRATFERPTRLPLAALFRVRAGVDAVAGSLPGGVAVGESLRVMLLQRRFGVPISEGASNAVVSRLVMALSQGVFVFAAVAMAGSPASPQSTHVGGGVVAPLAFLAATGGALLVLSRGRLLGQLRGVLQRLPVERLRAAMSRLKEPLARLDRGMATLARVPRSQCAGALAMFFVGWLCLGMEGWLILRLLGARPSLATGMSVEAIVSIARIGFFFLPGGLGAQEASYYGVLKLYGLPHAESIALAFAITKRAKDLLWIAVGYFFLLGPSARVPTSPMLAIGVKSP
jgi:uncharacterized protein (TIRG00374 family)